MNSPDPILPAKVPASLPAQSYTQLIDALSNAVFIGFIERGRLSLSSSANSIMEAGYGFLQRTHSDPWPRSADTLALIKRNIQIALLNGLIREGMPGVRTAVVDSYDRMLQAADPQLRPIQAATLLTVTDLPSPKPILTEGLLPESTPDASSDKEKPEAPLTREEVLLSIRKAVSQQLNKDIDTITIDTNFVDDLGADSLDLVELVMLLETLLEIQLVDSDMQQLGNMSQALDLACTRLHIAPPTMDDSQKVSHSTEQ